MWLNWPHTLLHLFDIAYHNAPLCQTCVHWLHANQPILIWRPLFTMVDQWPLSPTSRWHCGAVNCLFVLVVKNSDGFHDLFPWFSSHRSVRQEGSFRIVRSVAFPVAVNHGMHDSQLSRSDSAPPPFSFSNVSSFQLRSVHVRNLDVFARLALVTSQCLRVFTT